MNAAFAEVKAHADEAGTVNDSAWAKLDDEEVTQFDVEVFRLLAQRDP